MKIGILRPPLGIGGAEVTLTELAVNLRKLGHEVWLHFDRSSDMVDNLSAYGSIRARATPNAQELLESEEIFDQTWALEKLKSSDLVIIAHRHFFPEQLADAVNRVPRKLVYVPGKNEPHVTGVLRDVQAFGHKIQNIECFVFNSKHTLELHKSKDYPVEIKGKFYHLHPPMDFEYYSDLDPVRLRQFGRTELGIREHEFAVGVVGKVTKLKNPHRALEIAQALFAEIPNAKLFFIGDGPLHDEILEKARALGIGDKVFISGMIDSPFARISAMDAVLHLCEVESMSRALRESMLLGIPVAAHNTAGNRELCAGALNGLCFLTNEEAVSQLSGLAKDKYKRELFSQLSQERIRNMESEAVAHLSDLLKSAE